MSNQQPYPSYDGHDPHEGQQAPSAQEPRTQTWEGQTWDTQFQPVQQQYPASGPAAEDTTYLPDRNGAYPLPPETTTPYAPQASSYEPAPGGYEPASARYDRTPGGQEPTPGAYEPASGRYERTPGGQEPTSAAYEPAPGRYDRAPGGQEPAWGAYEPTPGAYQPAPGAYEPAAAGYDPAAAGYEPAHASAPAPAPGPAPAPAPGPASATAPGSQRSTGTAPSSNSPTATGNGHPQAGEAPLTAAQRARAEGRSPVIAPGMQPAALTAVLALLLAGAAAVGQYALVVPLVLLQAVTAAGWFRLNGMWPARQGIALAFLGGVTADIALLAVGAEHAPAAIIGTLGVWVLLALVLQLRNRAPADERMYGLTATVTSAALAVIAAGHLAAAPEAVTIGGVAVAVAVLARALPLPGIASVVVALLAAAGAGVAAGGMTDAGAKGALLGLAAGVCALIGLRVASYDYPSRFVHMTAGVALPLTAAAPAVYLIGRVIS